MGVRFPLPRAGRKVQGYKAANHPSWSACPHIAELFWPVPNPVRTVAFGCRQSTFGGDVFLFSSGIFEVQGGSPVKHKEIRWNPYTQEWFCVVCSRTSDHVSETDARNELDMYECELPVKNLGQ